MQETQCPTGQSTADWSGMRTREARPQGPGWCPRNMAAVLPRQEGPRRRMKQGQREGGREERRAGARGMERRAARRDNESAPCGEPSDSGNKGISGAVINKKDNTSPQAPGYSSPGLIFSCRALALQATQTQTPFPKVFIRRTSGPTTNSRSTGAGRGLSGRILPWETGLQRAYNPKGQFLLGAYSSHSEVWHSKV